MYPGNGSQEAALDAEIITLPSGVSGLKIKCNLRIKAKGKGIKNLDINIKGERNLNEYESLLYQWRDEL